MRRVMQSIGLFTSLAEEEVVRDEHERAADARHLLERACRILEVMRCYAAGDDVEALVGKRDLLGAADDVGLHPGCRSRSSRRGARPRGDDARRARPRWRRPARSRLRPTRRRARGRGPGGARRSRGRPRHAPTRHPSCGQLHRAPGRVEHRRLDVDVVATRSRRGSACPPRRSCRRTARRSGARSSSCRVPRACRGRPRRSA